MFQDQYDEFDETEIPITPENEHSASNLGEISRIMGIVRRATSRGGWWDTGKGQAATKALQGWGATERERILTGDPTAEPRSIGGGGSGSRSKGSVSSILLTHSMVHDWLKARTPEQVGLLQWIYIHGTEDRVLVSVYVLPSGSVSEPVEESAPIPPAYLAFKKKVTLAEAHIQTCDLINFPDRAGIREGLELWQIDWREWVEEQHVRLGQQLVKDLGL